jgi:hypothetical protein
MLGIDSTSLIGEPSALLRAYRVGFARAAQRLLHEQRCDRAQEAGDGGDEEGLLPAVILGDVAADQEAQRDADRQPEHEHRQRVRALVRREQVADQRRRRRRARRLAQAHAEPHHEELAEVLAHTGGGGEQTPHEHADAQDPRPAEAVCQAPERQPDQRIEQRERGAERAERGVAQRPFPPQHLADRAQEVAVEEVHRVDGKQHRQGEMRASSIHSLTPSPEGDGDLAIE